MFFHYFVIAICCLEFQVGCPLRCSFCATGKGGFSRNLWSHEIVEQVCVIPCPFSYIQAV